MSSSPGPDPFEFLKAIWSPMGIPVPGMVSPTLDVSELDRRIAELRSVENWLNLNLNVLRMSIQALEMQKATLGAIRAGVGGNASPGGTASSGAFPDAWWSVLQNSPPGGGKPGGGSGS